MEEEFKELISLLENKLQPEAESSLNIKGAAIVALMTRQKMWQQLLSDRY
jgi:hypothetical protein